MNLKKVHMMKKLTRQRKHLRATVTIETRKDRGKVELHGNKVMRQMERKNHRRKMCTKFLKLI